MKSVKLGDVADLQNGYAFKSTDYISFSNTLNFRMSNIRPDGNSDINYHPKYLPDDFASKYKDYLLQDGDVVIAMTDMASDPKILGVPTIVYTHGKNLLLNQRVGKFTRINLKEIFLPYLKYCLSSNRVKRYYKSLGGGGLQINISKDSILSIKIPLPSIEVQKNIVKALDQVELLRQKRKQTLILLNVYIKSVFNEMFGDPLHNTNKYPLKRLNDISHNIFLGLTSKVDYVETGGFPLIRATDINEGRLSFEKVKFISNEQHKLITKNRITKKGDLLVSKSGSLGTCALVDTDTEFTTYESIITIQSSKEFLNNYFLICLLRNKNFQIKMLGGKVGGTVSHLNLEMFRNIEIPLPPIANQNKFAYIYEKTESIKVKMQLQSQELNNQFQAFMQKSFQSQL